MQLTNDEAPRAVDRIDYPGVVRRSFLPAVFLPANAMSGIGTRNLVVDHQFGSMIGNRHRVVADGTSLVLDVERDAKMRQDRLAGQLGDAMREFEKRRVIRNSHGYPRHPVVV